MAHSAEYISVPPVPVDHFVECCKLVVGLNAEYVPSHESGASMYVRPLLFASCAQLGLNPADEYTFVVFVMPTGVYHGVHAVDALILEDFDRAAPEGTGSAKLGGNYAPVLRFSERAKKEGFGITLHLDSKSRTEIDEFSTSGFIGIKYADKSDPEQKNVTLVVPDSKSVIKSVTSLSVQHIAAKYFNYTVETRSIPYEELREFDEVVAAGTAASLVPIRSITMRGRDDKFTFGNQDSDEPGPVCLKLLNTLKGMQMGKVEDKFGWCLEVPKPDFDVSGGGKENRVEKEAVDSLP